MASSPACLQQEAQSSPLQASVSPPPEGGMSDALQTTSIAPYVAPARVSGSQVSKSSDVTASDTTQESDRAKCVSSLGTVVLAPSAHYNGLPVVGSTPGSYSPSFSNSVSRSNTAAAPVFQPPASGLSPLAAPSFSYNLSCTSGSFPNSEQQLLSNTHPALGHSQLVKSTPLFPAANIQPPAANPFPPGTAVTIMPPPKGASSNAATFTFNGNPQLMQKDQPLKSATFAAGAQSSASSPAQSLPQSASITVHTSSSSATATLTSTLAPGNSWMHPQSTFPGMPGTPGPPGIAPSAPVSSHLAVSSASAESSSVPRPNLAAASMPPGPSIQQHIYSPYPSLPHGASSPQGIWLQPPQMGGFPRPPFLSYPAAFPGPFTLPARGITLPSVPLPDSQPSGVTPVVNVSGTAVPSLNSGHVGGTALPSLNSGHQVAHNSGLQPELTAPGIDSYKQRNGISIKGEAAVNEQSDAWTAHKTDSGAFYYYNALTGESTYEKPADFKGQPDKATVQPTPVSWEKLVGTDWALVTTNDDKKYYYNTKTKLSSWQVPTEVAELRKKQDAGASNNPKEHSVPVPDTNSLTEKASAPVSLSAPAINTGGRDAISLRASAGLVSTSALDLIKKKLQDSGGPATSSSVPGSPGQAALELNGSRAVDSAVKGLQSDSKDKPKDVNGDGNLSDSSSDSEDGDSGPTKEERIIQFKEMLKERGVAPFSKWERELPKIVFDPRFKAVPSYSVRRSLFEHYVKTRAEEERKEKRAAQKAAIEHFKQLLEEASEEIDHNTDYHTFRKKWGNDPRFEALPRKDRELLLSERVLPLKKAAEEEALAIRASVASSFKTMLQEKGDITVNTRWSWVKDSLRNDLRYKLVNHDEREVLFTEYISELRAASEKAEQMEKAKKDEREKLKERERELRKRKEREEQEMERVRLKVRRKEAAASFQALLVESIKDPLASFTEAKSKLEKDPQRRASNADLDSSDIEKLFREHTKMLHERCINEFKALLSDALTAEAAATETEDGKTALTSWSTAKRLLKADPRYAKTPRKDREPLWRRYADEMQRKSKLAGEDRRMELKTRSSADSTRLMSGSRRTHERR